MSLTSRGAPDDSQISVTVGASENVTAQDFVDEIPASIAGNVSRDDNNDDAGDTNLSGITVTLDDGAGNILTTTTDVDGNYLFEDVTPVTTPLLKLMTQTLLMSPT